MYREALKRIFKRPPSSDSVIPKPSMTDIVRTQNTAAKACGGLGILWYSGNGILLLHFTCNCYTEDHMGKKYEQIGHFF